MLFRSARALRDSRRASGRVVTRTAPRGCPLCRAAGGEVLFSQHFAEVGSVTPVTGYDVTICPRCGFAYADGIPDQAAFDRYYGEMSKYEYHQREGAESPFDASRLSDVADDIAARVPDHSVRVLDIGCATGRLLANLRDRGFADVTGADPSPTCAAAAMRLHGIRVENKTLRKIGESGEQYGLVIVGGEIGRAHV